MLDGQAQTCSHPSQPTSGPWCKAQGVDRGPQRAIGTQREEGACAHAAVMEEQEIASPAIGIDVHLVESEGAQSAIAQRRSIHPRMDGDAQAQWRDLAHHRRTAGCPAVDRSKMRGVESVGRHQFCRRLDGADRHCGGQAASGGISGCIRRGQWFWHSPTDPDEDQPPTLVDRKSGPPRLIGSETTMVQWAAQAPSDHHPPCQVSTGMRAPGWEDRDRSACRPIHGKSLSCQARCQHLSRAHIAGATERVP